jgi:FkbM family methyltransferase
MSDELDIFLKNASVTTPMPENHVKYLTNLKDNDVKPKIIYDIGANVLQWTREASKIWKDSEFFVFDGFDKLEHLYKNSNLKYYVGILGDEDEKEVKWYQNDCLNTGNSYYKEHDDKVFPKDKFFVKKIKTLTTVVKELNFPYPDLVKIDVQGCEKDIIKGGIDIIRHAKHLIVELQHVEYNLGAPKCFDTIPYIESLGFKLVTPLFCNNGPDGDYHFMNMNII